MHLSWPDEDSLSKKVTFEQSLRRGGGRRLEDMWKVEHSGTKWPTSAMREWAEYRETPAVF